MSNVSNLLQVKCVMLVDLLITLIMAVMVVLAYSVVATHSYTPALKVVIPCVVRLAE